MTTRNYTDAEILYRQGDSSDQIFELKSGYIKFVSVNTTGSNAIVGIINAGEIFGPGLLSNGTSRQTAMSKGDSTVSCFTRQDYFNKLSASPEESAGLITRLATREASLQKRLQAIITLDLKGRIAMALHDLMQDYGGQCQHGHEIDMPLTHQELADMVGGSRPAVSSVLNQLRSEGLLGYTRDYICIEDLAALRATTQGLAVA